MPGTDAGPSGYRMADIHIDCGTRQVRRGNTVLQLPGLSFDLLLALVRRAPNMVNSGELMGEVWAGRVVNDETIAKRVELVRDALGDDSREARYIAVVRGRGYRIVAGVEALGTPPATVVPAKGRRRGLLLALVVASLAGGLALAVWWRRGEAARDPAAVLAQLPARPALAVLPLENLSSGESGEYFAAGMHDALIADLSKASGIKVISRTSTLPYRDSGKSLSAIAGELGVDLIMEGTVLRAGDRVRITVQLLDAGDTHLWADHYEGDLHDVLQLQSQVARAVAQAVKVKLSPVEEARLAGRPVNVESYEIYLQGNQLIESRTPDGFEKGVALLTRAAELDPSSALPAARLARAYSTRAHAPGAAKSLYPRATAYALQAIGLDGNLADGHLALAEMRLYFHWDWQGAEESFRKVFELAPSLAPAHAHYGWLRILQGDYPGGIAELRLATELDPNKPLWRTWLAWAQMHSGDLASSEKELQTVLRSHPAFPDAYHVLGQTLLRLGRNREAIAAFRKAAELSPLWSWGLGQGLAFNGQIEEARTIAQELEKSQAPDAWALAEVYCAIGDFDRAAYWIEQGYEERRDWMPWIQVNTFLAPMQDHPRFKEIVRRLDLPHPGRIRRDSG